MTIKPLLSTVLAASAITATAASQVQNYSSLIKRHYSTPEMREKLNNTDPECDWIMTTTGRFNGSDLDRLTIFPVESSLINDESCGGYAQMLIKSEKGTVPDLIVSREREDDFGFGFGSEYGSDFGITVFNNVFGKGEPARDGLKVCIHPEGSTLGSDYFYLLRDGKWVLTPPLDPSYMTLEECASAWPEIYSTLNVTGSWCKDWNGDKQVNTVALFPTPSGDYVIKMNTSEEDKFLEVIDNGYSVIEGKPVGVSVYPDWWSLGEQLLLVELQDAPYARLYRLTWNDPDGFYVNSHTINNGGLWIEVGKAVRDEAAPGLWQVTRTDSEQLNPPMPWWCE